LTYLVERHGRLVTKAELIDAIWPDAAVTDNSLAQCLAEIRRALDDDGQQTIRTVARRGYLFAAPVTTPPAKFTRSATGTAEGPPAIAAPARGASDLWKVAAAVIVCAVAVGGFLFVRSRSRNDLIYTQLT